MKVKPLFVVQSTASLTHEPYKNFLNNLQNSKALHLDIGAGTGSNVSFSESLGLEPIALEYDPDYTSRIPVEKIVRGVSDKLPFNANSFDVVSLIHVLEHLPKYQQTLAEIHRVTKPGGLFIVEVPNKYSLQEFFNYLYTHFILKKINKHLGHCNFFTYYRLKKIISENGFSVIDQKITGGPIKTTYNTINTNFLRLLKWLSQTDQPFSENYDFNQRSRKKQKHDLMMNIDEKINKHTYLFVEFIGFVCRINK